MKIKEFLRKDLSFFLDKRCTSLNTLENDIDIDNSKLLNSYTGDKVKTP